MPRRDLVLCWLTAIWLFRRPDRCSADQASYLGITPGRTTQEQLLASSEWGRPGRHSRSPRGGSELEYDFANGLQATVVVHDRSVLTVDLRPARPLTSREAVWQFMLRDTSSNT